MFNLLRKESLWSMNSGRLCFFVCKLLFQTFTLQVVSMWNASYVKKLDFQSYVLIRLHFYFRYLPDNRVIVFSVQKKTLYTFTESQPPKNGIQ